MPADALNHALEGLRRLIATPELPELGPGPRAEVCPLGKLNRDLDECLSRASLPAAVHHPIRAAVLLWHDHLDASHRIAQDLPGADGSYLHAIMHRREPDYGNAKYWFHRVGKHPCFLELARKAAALLESRKQTALSAELVADGEWDPFAFVDACERAAGRPAAETQLLRAIQACEFELLLARFCQS